MGGVWLIAGVLAIVFRASVARRIFADFRAESPLRMERIVAGIGWFLALSGALLLLGVAAR